MCRAPGKGGALGETSCLRAIMVVARSGAGAGGRGDDDENGKRGFPLRRDVVRARAAASSR